MGKRVWRDIVVRGEVFATVAEAAARFGVTQETVRIALKRGTAHRVGTGKTGVEPMPIRVRGVVYRDARAAAAAFGLSPPAIWQAIHHGRIDMVGLPPRAVVPHRSRRVVIGGVAYPSMAAADRALGFKPGYMSHAIQLDRASAQERILAAAMALAARSARRFGRAA